MSKLIPFNFMLYSTVVCFLLIASTSVFSKKRNQDVYKFPELHHLNTSEIIHIPDIERYQTLKCDFHTYTIFSDGHVSPVLRVNEAWSNGFDAIAITDHVEYRPFKEYVVANYNKSNEVSVAHGKRIGFIVI